MHHYITDVFDIRQAGDHSPVGSVEEEKARILTEQIQKFMTWCLDSLYLSSAATKTLSQKSENIHIIFPSGMELVSREQKHRLRA